MRKRLLAASAAAALGVLSGGNAQAQNALAQSILQITDFQFLTGLSSNGAAPAPTSQLLNASVLTGLTIADQTNLSPTLNGAGAPSPVATPVVVGGGALPLQIQCASGGTCTSTPFVTLTPPATSNAAIAASQLNGAPIAGLPTASPNPLGANARSSALAQVTSAGVANTTAGLTLQSAFTFVAGAAIPITIDFNGNISLTTYLENQFSAVSGATLSFSLTDISAGNATVFQWTPNGAAGGITGGTEQFDACNLSNTTNEGIPGGTATYNCGGYFEATTNALVAGDHYSLNINQQNQANVLVAPSVVPEPGSLALVGLALAGLGFTGVRRKKSS